MLLILLSRIEYVQLNLTKVATLEEKVRSHVREVEKSLQAPHLPEGTSVLGRQEKLGKAF